MPNLKQPIRQRALLAGMALCLAAAMVLLLGLPRAEASPPAQSPDEGQTIFQQKCAACHTIGGGDKVGPDLAGVTQRRDQDWLVRWITVPDKMLADKDPIATDLLAKYNNTPMPNLGISKEDALSLIAYFQQAEGGEGAAAGAEKPALPAGDAARGRALFMGETAFASGAPPCISCHTVSGVGALGGGAMGPDLTQVINRFGEDGLASVLAAPPFPAMKPIFADHPLSPQEQADLIAFFKSTASAPPANANLQLGLVGAVVFVIFMVLAQVIWRHRNAGVRRPMVEQAKI